jgi:hypothetical protein
MPNVWAISTGNWSTSSIWNTGAVPTASDAVWASGSTVTLNQDINVISLNTFASGTIGAGGSFNVTSSRNIKANVTAGTITGNWTLSAGSRLQATYADLAEYYSADVEYEPGTVLIFGGTAEVTTTTIGNDSRVAGVVTTNPAYVMNSELQGVRACVALQGRVPVKVLGIIKKGDLITTSSIPGYACKAMNPQVGTIIGKAVADKLDPNKGIIEVAVGRL